MSSKTRRTSMKYSTVRCKTLRSLGEITRSRPQCAACNINFENIRLLEQHLQTEEHKMVDAPLQFILHRVEKTYGLDGFGDYKNLRLQASKEELGENRGLSNSLDISGLSIGAECLIPTRVFFCHTCNTYVPQDDPEASRRHCMSAEHTNKLSKSELR